MFLGLMAHGVEGLGFQAVHGSRFRVPTRLFKVLLRLPGVEVAGCLSCEVCGCWGFEIAGWWDFEIVSS